VPLARALVPQPLSKTAANLARMLLRASGLFTVWGLATLVSIPYAFLL
jgi:hypothetical protein